MGLALVLGLALSGCIASSASDHEPQSQPRQADGVGIISKPYGRVQLDLTIPDDLRTGRSATWQMSVVHRGTAGDPSFGYSSICRSPWQVVLYDADGEAVALREPRGACEAYDTAYLEPGDSLGTTWSWDLRQWDAAADAYADLPPGDYALEFRFEHQDGEGGRGGGPTATHRFHLT